MKKIHLITYGDNHYTKSKYRLIQDAKKTGWFDTTTAYGRDDIDSEYKEEFKEILMQPRGSGYWIWKPYFILKRLKEIEKDDILIYLDAGFTIRRLAHKRFYEYIDMLEDNCMLSFQTRHLEKHYTTKQIFEHFNVLDRNEITETGQYLGGIRIMKNNEETRRIIQLEYDSYKENKLMVTDYYNDVQEEYFIDNRHEQSVFSVIRKMHKTAVLNDETEKVGSVRESKKFPFYARRMQDRHLSS